MAAYIETQSSFRAQATAIMCVERFPVLMDKFAYECKTRNNGKIPTDYYDRLTSLVERGTTNVSINHACDECNRQILQMVDSYILMLRNVCGFIRSIEHDMNKNWIYTIRFPLLFTKLVDQFELFLELLVFVK